jgi:phosphoribosyl-AMP cyclohydrolase
MYIDQIKFDDAGLVTVVAFDVDSRKVVMVAYMNAEALQTTLETGIVTYWSRSRQELWVKGGSSGHTQKLQWMRMDCDGDALLVGVKQNVAACHMGYFSCFYREYCDGDWQVVDERIFDPAATYGR